MTFGCQLLGVAESLADDEFSVWQGLGDGCRAVAQEGGAFSLGA